MSVSARFARRLAIALTLCACHCAHAADPPATTTSIDEILRGHKLTTVLETSFDEPIRFVREGTLVDDGHYVRQPADDVEWILDGPGNVRVEEGRLIVECAEGHSVLWNRREFPADILAEWEFTHHHPQGLAIFFFAARSGQGGSVHDVGLPERNGVFSNYTKGAINCYHTSYFAIDQESGPRGETHLRKNAGFHLVADGPSVLDGTSRGPHRIRVLKLGPRILLEVDGQISFNWTDPGKSGESGVAPLGGGQIGLRQMKHTIEASYGDLKIQSID